MKVLLTIIVLIIILSSCGASRENRKGCDGASKMIGCGYDTKTVLNNNR